jgi:3-hydroxybutyryl-CoA dehydrogenase
MAGERIAVVGAGLMGHGIAQVLSCAGYEVAIHDPDREALRSVPPRVRRNLELLGLDPASADAIELHGDLASCVEGAGFAFEAAPERVELKQALFHELDALLSPGVVLATNTSVISIGEIARDTAHPERVVGTHWWNPPYLIPLVEVVQAEGTSDAVVTRTIELLEAAGKSPVHVRRDIPGFVGNRLQHALWREAFALVEDGVCDAETIDRVVKKSFGLRLPVLGPMETADLVGLDLTLDIHGYILPHLDRTPGPAPILRAKVERGELGMKTGRGFRTWTDDEARRVRENLLEHLAAAAAHGPAAGS